MPKKTKIVIECSGGVVTAVYGNKNIEITLVDWDDVAEGDLPVDLAVAPLCAMPEETREAIIKR
jgi:hypothetical protein